MPKKLSLKVEEINVEQFHVQSSATVSAGTVRGYETSTCACGPLSDADTDPCRFCPEMPITYSCDACG
jgi:hypothetical protein